LASSSHTFAPTTPCSRLEPEQRIRLEDILITPELSVRPQRMPNREEENTALRSLAKVMATAPNEVPDTLLQFALKLCRAGTAGLSLLEPGFSGEEVFRWTNLAGTLSSHLGGSTPRKFSPCGVCLDHNSPQLFSCPGKYFRYFETVQPAIVEALVIPLVPLGDDPLGTIWIVSHDENIKFDAEDVRIMTSLAEFTTSALRISRMLKAEQTARQTAEIQVEESTSALRTLSNSLIHLQDDERRRIARALHDSVGQCLTVLKIDLELMKREAGPANAELLSRCLESLEMSLSETRTISHLLHPPLLDEAGFASAAQSYVEEFAKRAGLSIVFDVPPQIDRMPPAMEIALFRMLQESLTNVHRHSGSTKVEIELDADAEAVALTVRDYGRGMPAEVVDSFRNNGGNLGVGLAGLKARVRELGGEVDVHSNTGGTTIIVTIPLPATAETDS
jgi:signal transduction histidine kinase